MSIDVTCVWADVLGAGVQLWINRAIDRLTAGWVWSLLLVSAFEDIAVLSSFVDSSIMSMNEDSAGGRSLMGDITIADWNKLGATIKAERARLALSQHELAARAGVSRSWLAKLEAGHRGAEFEQILRLLEALGLSLVLRSDTTTQQEDSSMVAPAGLDTKAMQTLMDKHQRSAESRRRAWSAAAHESAGHDHG